MENAEVCHLALNSEDFPYIIPLNFGMQTENGKIVLYFHGAEEGTKYDLIAKDNRASFEMLQTGRLITEEETGNCTMEYESVIGQGHIFFVPEEEKNTALRILMAHYHKEAFAYNEKMVPRTTLFKLVVEHISGKRRAR